MNRDIFLVGKAGKTAGMQAKKEQEYTCIICISENYTYSLTMFRCIMQYPHPKERTPHPNTPLVNYDWMWWCQS